MLRTTLKRGLSNLRYHSTHSVGATRTSESELTHFNALAASWWDPNGPQRILHKMNLLRMDFLRTHLMNAIPLNSETPTEDEPYVPGYSLDLLPSSIASEILKEQDQKRRELLKDVEWRALDIGCGGGLLTESLARLPYINSVKGLDLSPRVIEVAKHHTSLDPLIKDKVQYELKPLEEETDQYDIVTMMEMLEHVDHPSAVLEKALSVLKPGGWLFLSTINRGAVSYFTTIFMGEYVLGIVPKGTHTWEKYIDSKELRHWFRGRNAEVVESKGCLYVPFKGWIYGPSEDTGNYLMAVRKLQK